MAGDRNVVSVAMAASPASGAPNGEHVKKKKGFFKKLKSALSRHHKKESHKGDVKDDTGREGNRKPSDSSKENIAVSANIPTANVTVVDGGPAKDARASTDAPVRNGTLAHTRSASGYSTSYSASNLERTVVGSTARILPAASIATSPQEPTGRSPQPTVQATARGPQPAVQATASTSTNGSRSATADGRAAPTVSRPAVSSPAIDRTVTRPAQPEQVVPTLVPLVSPSPPPTTQPLYPRLNPHVTLPAWSRASSVNHARARSLQFGVPEGGLPDFDAFQQQLHNQLHMWRNNQQQFLVHRRQTSMLEYNTNTNELGDGAIVPYHARSTHGSFHRRSSSVVGELKEEYTRT